MQAPHRTRLLIVEDHDDTATILQLGLTDLGYEVMIAHNAPIALQLAQSFAPDIAVLDIGLPVMDGWELARRLRDRRSGLHVIAVTAFNDDDDRLRSDEAGFSYHLAKPVDIQAIHAAVQNLAAATDTRAE